MQVLRNRTLAVLSFALTAGPLPLRAAESNEAPQAAMIRQYCFSCHGKAAMGGVNLENLLARDSMGDTFQRWEKVAEVLEQKRMPPPKMPQPPDAARAAGAAWVRGRIDEFARKNAGDPGNVTLRRLTSGEYAYTIGDLTGLDYKVDRDFVPDDVGGEGFTNFGDVQFMQDATLERYLQAAKAVANHAVVGSGPLAFFSDPGKSGFELSAIDRIQKIYEANGFRAVAGEGGKPYGLDRYGSAFYACWRYSHRQALGLPNAKLEDFAAREHLNGRFVRHIWTVLQQRNSAYPTSEVVAKWRQLPAPAGQDEKAMRAACKEVQKVVIDWPRWLFAAGAMAEGGQGDERALVVTDASLTPVTSYRYKFNLRARRQAKARVYLSVVSVNPVSKDKPVVVWRNGTVRFRGVDRGPVSAEQPLLSVVDEASLSRAAFGKGGEFSMKSDGRIYLDIAAPENAGGVDLSIEAAIEPGQFDDAVVRCVVSDREEESKGRPMWALLANPASPGFRAWKADVLEFARNLPQISHGEPAPSDKDPIPAPYDNTYNQPERDEYHTSIKYYRTDRFLVENMLDEPTRQKLEEAWTDLLGSFEYHDRFARFIAQKYKLDLKSMADLDEARIAALPAEPREMIRKLHAEYRAVQKAFESARPRHVEDVLRFAAQAWRRPLTETEKSSLRALYIKASEGGKFDHAKGVRAALARVLVSPSFLYRMEQPATRTPGVKPLSGYELASRLSYFLWSSAPDEELRRAAAAGELNDPRKLESQVKRMMADPKARRMAAEFFGQWLGFYRFDQYKGVDTTRFPEFTDEVKASMHAEAVSFFEHILRKDRPVREILTADYTFLNKPLAKHYGLKQEVASEREPQLVTGANAFQRGGFLRLGAVLTATSAPLRTSPVKRGDWVLRRVLGTPTPPPPADAGTLPSDDKLFGGLSLQEKLAAHQRNATCAGCHSRIDPLGFPLERYDAVGRWRDAYSDGKPIHDASTSADHKAIAGVDGLVDYLKGNEDQVLRTVSKKLLGYALGRTVLLSDKPLVDKMVQAGGGATFAKLAVEIVSSPQFQHRREAGPDAASREVARFTLRKDGER